MLRRFAKDKRDPFYRRAKEVGFRARSAFKLLQLDSEFDLLNAGVRRVVDLCAAPGSWSQVLAARLVAARRAAGGAPAALVGVDLQAMAPIAGVALLQGDITAPRTARALRAALGGGAAHLVVCDGAPDVTGLHDVDEYLQWALLAAALRLAAELLGGGGAFVAKIFTGPATPLLVAALRTLFSDVAVYKPPSSRAGSREAFAVARGFAPADAAAAAAGGALARFLAVGDLARALPRAPPPPDAPADARDDVLAIERELLAAAADARDDE